MTFAVAGCGGSATKTVIVETQTRATTGGSEFDMPASAVPTTCTVYLTGQDALVEWASLSYNVAPACQNWISLNAKQGELWTVQLPTNDVPFDDVQVCSLANSDGNVTASVLDDGGQVNGKGACEGLTSAGWVEQNSSPPLPLSNSRPAADSPTLVVGGPGIRTFTGVEPSWIDFSGDAGNVVTDLVWTSWTQTQAVGQGTSNLQQPTSPDPQVAERLLAYRRPANSGQTHRFWIRDDSAVQRRRGSPAAVVAERNPGEFHEPSGPPRDGTPRDTVGGTWACWTPSFRNAFIESAPVSGKTGEFQAVIATRAFWGAEPEQLVAFFDHLAAAWRGWDGRK